MATPSICDDGTIKQGISLPKAKHIIPYITGTTAQQDLFRLSSPSWSLLGGCPGFPVRVCLPVT